MMPAEIIKNIFGIEDVSIDAKVFPDGIVLLEVNRGDYTHILNLSANGRTCEVVNTVRNKKQK